MRVLHTSDWHLGRTFHRVGLLDAQARFLDHLVEVTRSEQVDLVVVAGDVYDRALPPVAAVELLDQALARLLDAGARVVLSSGNHDSAQRLGFGRAAMDRGGLHIRTDPARATEPVLLEDRHGPVAVYPIPYLDPTLVAEAVGLEVAASSHQAVLSHVMDGIRADLAGRPERTRSLVAAHAFVVGGVASDSERDISVGGVAAVPTGVFDGVDYVALGHLHSRAELSETVRYSGSPLAYSFSEKDQRKGSWLVELEADGVRRVDFVDAPAERRLATLRGRLDDLLADPALEAETSAYCQVTLTDPTRPRQAMERLQTRFPHTLVLGFAPEGVATPIRDYATRLVGRADLDVCCDFLAHVRGGLAADDDERGLLREALEAVARAGGEPLSERSSSRAGDSHSSVRGASAEGAA